MPGQEANQTIDCIVYIHNAQLFYLNVHFSVHSEVQRTWWFVLRLKTKKIYKMEIKV